MQIELVRARHWLKQVLAFAGSLPEAREHAQALLAAMSDGGTDPRPDDMTELARLTAIELRKRGIWAYSTNFVLWTPRFSSKTGHVRNEARSICESDFDNLGPIGCADVIQAEESRRAREWAGDA